MVFHVCMPLPLSVAIVMEAVSLGVNLVATSPLSGCGGSERLWLGLAAYSEVGRLGAIEPGEIHRALLRLRDWCQQRSVDLNALNVQFCLADDRVAACHSQVADADQANLDEAFGIEVATDHGWVGAGQL